MGRRQGLALVLLCAAVTGCDAEAQDTRAGAAALKLAFSVSPPPPEHHADPSLKTYVRRVGPVTIGPYQTVKQTDVVKPPPVKGSIVGMDVRMVDERGREIPQNEVMLHHNVFTNGGPDNTRRDGACPDNAVRERFYGTSEELRPLTLPRGYGYPSSPRDKWKTIWMVMNHRHDLRKAYVEYRVTVDPRPGLTEVKPYWLSVIPCVSDPQYSVPGGKPPGSSHVKDETFRMPASGRIVAVGGHLHGGGRRLVLSQPDCEHRTLAVSQPTYAAASDPLYAVKPLLHEPDPKSIDWHQWDDGWGVAKGTRLKVSSIYEGSRPHMRVMGIAHVYLAPDDSVKPGCNPAPTKRTTLGPSFEGREEPPLVNLTLAAMGRDGKAHPIARPPGRIVRRAGDAEVLVRRFEYRPSLLSVPRGARVRWDFNDRRAHDTTVVSGPRGFATKNGRRHVARYRFEVPGTYKLYCSVHPTTMSSVVRVRR